MAMLLRCDTEHKLLNLVDISSLDLIQGTGTDKPTLKIKLTVGDIFTVSPANPDYQAWMHSITYGATSIGSTYFKEYPNGKHDCTVPEL